MVGTPAAAVVGHSSTAETATTEAIVADEARKERVINPDGRADDFAKQFAGTPKGIPRKKNTTTITKEIPARRTSKRKANVEADTKSKRSKSGSDDDDGDDDEEDGDEQGDDDKIALRAASPSSIEVKWLHADGYLATISRQTWCDVAVKIEGRVPANHSTFAFLPVTGYRYFEPHVDCKKKFAVMFCSEEQDLRFDVFPGSHARLEQDRECRGESSKLSFHSRAICPYRVNVKKGDVFVVLPLTLFKITTSSGEKPIPFVIANFRGSGPTGEDKERFPALYPSTMTYGCVVSNRSVEDDIIAMQYMFEHVEFGMIASRDEAGSDEHVQLKLDCLEFIRNGISRESATCAVEFDQLRNTIFSKTPPFIRLCTSWELRRVLEIYRRNRYILQDWLEEPDSTKSPDYETLCWFHENIAPIPDNVQSQMDKLTASAGDISLPESYLSMLRQMLTPPPIPVEWLAFRNVSGNIFTPLAKKELQLPCGSFCSKYLERGHLVLEKGRSFSLVSSCDTQAGSMIMEVCGCVSTVASKNAMQLKTKDECSVFLSCFETHGNSVRPVLGNCRRMQLRVPMHLD